MAADDLKAKAIISVYGDTSNAVRELNKLNDTQKKLGEGLDKTGVSFAQMLDKAAVGFAKFNLAIGGVTQAYGLLKQGMDITEEINSLDRMVAKLPGGVAALERLNEAQGGIVAKTDVLRAATRGMTGDFALSEVQMGKVLRAAVAYEQKGLMSAAEATEMLLKVTKNFSEKQLMELQINMEKTGDRTRDLATLMGELDTVIGDAGPIDERTAKLDDLGDTFEELGLAIKRTIAEAVNGLASLVKAANEADDWFQKKTGSGLFRALTLGKPATDGSHFGDRLWGYDNALFPGGVVPGYVAPDGPSFPSRRRAALGPAFTPMTEDDHRAMGEWRKANQRKSGAYNSNAYQAPDREVFPWSSAGEGDFGGAAWDSGSLDALEAMNAGVANRAGSGWDVSNLAGPANTGDGSTTGKAAEFMKRLADETTAAGAAFSVFNDAFAAGVMAAIDGSESIAKAAARAGAARLKALAVEYSVRAIGEGAFALSSLAFGDAKGAASHGASAGKFALAAAAAGVGSAALGALSSGGGGAASAPAGGGYASPTGGSRSGSGGDTYIINLGDGFVGEPQKLAEMISRAVRQSQRQGGRDSFATTFSGG